MENLDFENKKVAVLGMGMEGLALVDFLLEKGCEIALLDQFEGEKILSKLEAESKEKFSKILDNSTIKKILGPHYLEGLDSFDIIFRTPGISFLNPKIQQAKAAGVTISSQIKLFFDLCPCQIIGVTGTKGKGTTASLIFEILKKNLKFKISNLKSNHNSKISNEKNNPNVYLAGNIGYPAISLIPKLKDDDIVILELSSFQLMDLEKSPHVAVVTNLTVDHLDYHSDEDEYRKSKGSIIKFQGEGDFAILNVGSTFDDSIIGSVRASIKYFSSSSKGDAIVLGGEVILDPKNRNIKICDKGEIQLFGAHNLENIAAATLTADVLNVDVNLIKEVVRSFKGLPHRLEFVAEIDGIKFINDSFATNPEPTMAAINSLAENKILILGGSSKRADFSELAEKIADTNIKGVVLIGDEADNIEQALITRSYSGQIKKGVKDIDDIVAAAKSIASLRDVVILSPACASFGLFKNYKDRGDKFKKAVLKLQNHEL